jgi:hypothetical protein
MPRTDVGWASPNAHLLVGEMPAPRQMDSRWWEGTGLSIAAHAIAFGLLLYAATHVKQVVQTINAVSGPLVFLEQRGPGLVGGGAGANTPDPPRRPEIIATKRVHLLPVTNPADTPPPPDVTIPVVTAQAVQMLPGSMTEITASTGRGSSGGARGPGSGPGNTTGLGPGSLGTA